jgi:hypothetical protein
MELGKCCCLGLFGFAGVEFFVRLVACYTDVLQFTRRKLCQWRIFMPVTELGIYKFRVITNSQASSVVQRWATNWMVGGSNPERGWEFFSTPPRPDRLWDPPSLLSNGYQGLFPLVETAVA